MSLWREPSCNVGPQPPLHANSNQQHRTHVGPKIQDLTEDFASLQFPKAPEPLYRKRTYRRQVKQPAICRSGISRTINRRGHDEQATHRRDQKSQWPTTLKRGGDFMHASGK